MLASSSSALLYLKNPTNAAFHNLCNEKTKGKLPRTVRSLLGLGLNFCTQPKYRSTLSMIQLERLRKDYFREIMFAGQVNRNENEKNERKKLYMPDPTWQPKTPDNNELVNRLENFNYEMRRMFAKNKRSEGNLLPTQRAAMKWLLEHPEIIVCSADKNLGPVIMERDKYLKFAFNDHLKDTSTYTRLTAEEANTRIGQIRRDIDFFTGTFDIDKSDKTFITRSHEKVKDKNRTAFLYLTIKMHKTPIKTRPIISYCGSICEGIAKWTDQEIKKIVKHLPYVTKSSTITVKDLENIELNKTDKLFTMDAKSMYTNIHVNHALPKITNFLTNDQLGKRIRKEEGINVAALEFAIETIMKNNIFMFGDTYWLQKAGTAMGTPPAPDYATLYFALWEIEIIRKYDELKYYSRYIDDGLGIWSQLSPKAMDEQRWNEFQKEINSFGKDHTFFQQNPNYKPLEWEFSPRSSTAIFLDLTINIKDKKIATTIFEKKLNLHLYIPPHSCHSPGTTKSLIYGTIKRAKSLCTDSKDVAPYIIKTHDRLVARGHNSTDIKRMIMEALHAPEPKHGTKKKDTPSLFLHLPFNPMDPQSRLIQRAFKDTILQPNDQHISSIHPVPFKRLTICYHGQKKLGDALAPRRLRLGEYLVSTFLESMKRYEE